jgi:hypothetical protein
MFELWVPKLQEKLVEISEAVKLRAKKEPVAPISSQTRPACAKTGKGGEGIVQIRASVGSDLFRFFGGGERKTLMIDDCGSNTLRVSYLWLAGWRKQQPQQVIYFFFQHFPPWSWQRQETWGKTNRGSCHRPRSSWYLLSM